MKTSSKPVVVGIRILRCTLLVMSIQLLGGIHVVVDVDVPISRHLTRTRATTTDESEDNRANSHNTDEDGDNNDGGQAMPELISDAATREVERVVVIAAVVVGRILEQSNGLLPGCRRGRGG